MKLQSAIEYLTTYGWALLIIAIALFALFELNVFNSNYYAPKASPGSCSVYRPDGPNTTTNIELTGFCNSELPEYVFGSQGPGIDVDIANSGLQNSTLDLTNNITIVAWVEVFGSPSHDVVDKEGQYAMKLDNGTATSSTTFPGACNLAPPNFNGWCLEWDISNYALCTPSCSQPGNPGGMWFLNSGEPIPGMAFNKWEFLAVSRQGTERYWYADGSLIGSYNEPGLNVIWIPTNVVIGTQSENDPYYQSPYPQDEWFDGLISNVQIYNTALSQNGIAALYQEGIGGAPIDLQNIVAWWPLNGDTNDYSGNGNDGISNSIVYFNGVWWTTYSSP